MKILIILFTLAGLYSCGRAKDDQKTNNSNSREANGSTGLETCKIFFQPSDSLIEISIKANQIRTECNVSDERVLVAKLENDLK